MMFEDWSRRSVTSTEFIKYLNDKLKHIADLKVYIYQPGFKGTSGSPIKYVIKGNSFDQINNMTLRLIKDANEAGIIVNADSNYSARTPEIEAVIDYNRAAVLGVTMTDISNALQTYLGGTTKTSFEENDTEYNVYIRAEEKLFKDITDIASLNIRTENGEMVSLGSVAEFRLVAKARKLPHFDRQKAITISAHPAADKSLGEALDWMDAWAAKNLDKSMSVSLNGESRNFRDSENEMLMNMASEKLPVVPLKSLVYAGEDRYVFVVNEENKVFRRKVVLGPVNGAMVAVNQGLRVGTSIVVEGVNRIHDGDTVAVIKQEDIEAVSGEVPLKKKDKTGTRDQML